MGRFIVGIVVGIVFSIFLIGCLIVGDDDE